MSDDDNTPRWTRPARVQTSDDRALAAAKRRAVAPPRGVPITAPPPRSEPDVTSPFELFEREPDDEAKAIVQRSRRNSGDPATVDDVAKLLVAFHKERSANAQRERDAEVVLAGPHKAHRATRRNLIATVIAAAAAIAAVAKQWVEHPAAAAAADGEAVRVELLQKAVERIDTELRAMRFELGRREGPR